MCFQAIISFLMTMMWSIYVCISGGDKNFIYKEWWSSFPMLKSFYGDALFFSFFVCSYFISLNYLAPICYLKLGFKQKLIHLFWATCIFFLIFWLTKRYQEIHAQSKCGWIKELHNNLRNFGFRNPFCLYKNYNLELISKCSGRFFLYGT